MSIKRFLFGFQWHHCRSKLLLILYQFHQRVSFVYIQITWLSIIKILALHEVCFSLSGKPYQLDNKFV